MENHCYTCSIIMRCNEIYQQLVSAFTLDVSVSEKRATILWLMQDKLGVSEAEILAGKELKTSPVEFVNEIQRLNREEPLQYILGKAEFYGREFEVNPSVLIPRPETELLVQHVIDQMRKSTVGTLLDVGTGSGCIAIILALELPTFKVVATDVSSSAVELAKRNANSMGVEIQFMLHDILKDELQMPLLDVVVSNPPYILKKEAGTLKRNVLAHEPGLALFVPDDDPFIFHRTIAEKAKKSLKPGGLLIMEINENFGDGTAAVLQASGYSDAKTLKDLDNKDRFVSGHTSG